MNVVTAFVSWCLLTLVILVSWLMGDYAWVLIAGSFIIVLLWAIIDGE